MSSYQVIVEAPAIIDIESARADLANWSEEYAERWYESVKSYIRSLEHMPRRFAVAPESEHVGREVRDMLVGKYRVLFVVDGQKVHVVHVRHAALPPLPPEEGL